MNTRKIYALIFSMAMLMCAHTLRAQTQGSGTASLNMDDLNLPGFSFVEARFYVPTSGTTYYYDKIGGNYSMHITVNVCASKQEALAQVSEYFSINMHGYLESTDTISVGDTTWTSRRYQSLVFVDGNVKVIIHSTNAASPDFTEVEVAARLMETLILASPPALPPVSKSILFPTMPQITLNPAQPKLGQQAEIILSAQPGKNPKSDALYFTYLATGGNVLKGPNGKMYYRPFAVGNQTLEVYAGNYLNVISKSILQFKVMP